MSTQRVLWPLPLLVSFALSFAVLFSVATPPNAWGQPTRVAAEQKAQAIERLVMGRGDAGLTAFLMEHIDPSLRQSRGDEQLLGLLREIRSSCRDKGGIEIELHPPGGVRLRFMNDVETSVVSFRVDRNPPHQLIELDLSEEEGSADPSPMGGVPPITWDNLYEEVRASAEEGFSGTVLVVRGGKVVLHESYGLADQDRSIPNTTNTLFAIGSTPIDFTYAAILKLADMGRLSLDDPVTRFLDDVPEDKTSMTLRHLTQGASGLTDFHHIPGVDEDYDLSWIDRDTAVERILGGELLFAPGSGNQHSHSAWVLLAAIVEIVSGDPYGEFLRTHFFEPANMTRTGLYRHAQNFPRDEIAVGHGGMTPTDPNSPIAWGPTSWLVMGSGGMVSTPEDLFRFAEFVRGDDALSKEYRDLYWHDTVTTGGNDRGFFCASASEGADRFFLCSNDHGMSRDAIERELGHRLSRLIQGSQGGRMEIDTGSGSVDVEGGPDVVMQGGSEQEAGSEIAGGSELEAHADRAFQRGRYEDAIEAYLQLRRDNPENWQYAFRVAHAYHLSGNYEKSVEAHRVAAEFPEARPVALYNMACAQALLGRTDEAFVTLRQAIDAGFDRLETIRGDSDLESLRGDPRFDALFASNLDLIDKEAWVGSFPDTPAGRRVEGFFQALASPDPDEYVRYGRENRPMAEDQDVVDSERRAQHSQFRSMWGELLIESVTEEPDRIRVRAQDTRQGAWREFGFDIQSSAPHLIQAIQIEQTRDPREARIDEEPWTDLQDLLSRVRDRDGVPAIAAAVVKDGKIVDSAAVGVRRAQESAPVQIQDVFHWGSVGKALTGTMLGVLMEDGVLDGSLTLREAFPDWDMHADYENVTIDMLMSHRGGVEPMTNFLGPQKEPEDRVAAREEYFRKLLRESPYVRPGTQQVYSNAGISLAAHIAETRTGRSWRELVRETVFEPAGMKASGFGYPQGEEQPSGHRRAGRGFAFAGHFAGSPATVEAAGNIHSSIEDMARFALIHLDGLAGRNGVLDPKTVRLLHTPQDGPGERYAYGWGIEQWPDAATECHWHNGSGGHYFALVRLVPEHDFGVVVLMNAYSAGLEAAADELSEAVFRRFVL